MPIVKSQSDFSLLKSIKGSIALRSLTLMQTLSKEGQLELALALAKKHVNEKVLRVCGEYISEKDRELWERFRYHSTIAPHHVSC